MLEIRFQFNGRAKSILFNDDVFVSQTSKKITEEQLQVLKYICVKLAVTHQLADYNTGLLDEYCIAKIAEAPHVKKESKEQTYGYIFVNPICSESRKIMIKPEKGGDLDDEKEILELIKKMEVNTNVELSEKLKTSYENAPVKQFIENAHAESVRKFQQGENYKPTYCAKFPDLKTASAGDFPTELKDALDAVTGNSIVKTANNTLDIHLVDSARSITRSVGQQNASLGLYKEKVEQGLKTLDSLQKLDANPDYNVDELASYAKNAVENSVANALYKQAQGIVQKQEERLKQLCSHFFERIKKQYLKHKNTKKKANFFKEALLWTIYESARQYWEDVQQNYASEQLERKRLNFNDKYHDVLALSTDGQLILSYEDFYQKFASQPLAFVTNMVSNILSKGSSGSNLNKKLTSNLEKLNQIYRDALPEECGEDVVTYGKYFGFVGKAGIIINYQEFEAKLAEERKEAGTNAQAVCDRLYKEAQSDDPQTNEANRSLKLILARAERESAELKADVDRYKKFLALKQRLFTAHKEISELQSKSKACSDAVVKVYLANNQSNVSEFKKHVLALNTAAKSALYLHFERGKSLEEIKRQINHLSDEIEKSYSILRVCAEKLRDDDTNTEEKKQYKQRYDAETENTKKNLEVLHKCLMRLERKKDEAEKELGKLSLFQRKIEAIEDAFTAVATAKEANRLKSEVDESVKHIEFDEATPLTQLIKQVNDRISSLDEEINKKYTEIYKEVYPKAGSSQLPENYNVDNLHRLKAEISLLEEEIERNKLIIDALVLALQIENQVADMLEKQKATEADVASLENNSELQEAIRESKVVFARGCSLATKAVRDINNGLEEAAKAIGECGTKSEEALARQKECLNKFQTSVGTSGRLSKKAIAEFDSVKAAIINIEKKRQEIQVQDDRRDQKEEVEEQQQEIQEASVPIVPQQEEREDEPPIQPVAVEILEEGDAPAKGAASILCEALMEILTNDTFWHGQLSGWGGGKAFEYTNNVRVPDGIAAMLCAANSEYPGYTENEEAAQNLLERFSELAHQAEKRAKENNFKYSFFKVRTNISTNELYKMIREEIPRPGGLPKPGRNWSYIDNQIRENKLKLWTDISNPQVKRVLNRS